MSRFLEILKSAYGFQASGDDALAREWSKDVEVAWYGKSTETYRVEVYLLSSDAVSVSFLKNGRVEKQKVYSFGCARTLNAIKSTVEYAGYKMEV